MDIQTEYNHITNEKVIDDKIKYLKTIKSNILIRSYVHSLIGGLYIKLLDHGGYANEVVKDELLTDFSYEATASMIPFFKDSDCLIRGILDNENNNINHSWIEFILHNKEYIFDPALNIIVKKQDYENIFAAQGIASISSYQVKSDLLETLATGKETTNGFKQINKSNDINSSFYQVDMQVKGETINRKILTLTAKYESK